MSKRNKKQIPKNKAKINKKQVPKKQETQTKNQIQMSALLVGIIIGLALFFFSGLLVPKTSILANLDIKESLFFFLKILFSISIFLLILYKDNPKSKLFSKSIFLALILFYLFISIISKLEFTELFFQKNPIYILLQEFLIPSTILFGVLSTFFYKDKLNEITNIEKQNIDVKENPAKRSKVSKFINKEGIIYLTILIVIFIIAFFTYSHKLSHYDIFEDEFQMMSVATGHYHSREYKHWNYAKEEIIESKYGVKPQIWVLSQAFKLFGVSKGTARGVSVFMGLLFVFISYFISRYFIKNKIIALLVPLIVIFYPSYLHLFRYIRMYALVIPLSFIIFWLMHKGVTTNNFFKFKILKLDLFIEKYINFNFIFLIISIPLIVINYRLHQVSLITVPAIFIYTIYLAFSEKKVKYYIASGIGFIGFIIIFLFFDRYLPYEVMTFFKGRDWLYLKWMFNYPFTKNLIIILLLIGISFFVLLKSKKLKHRIVYFYIIIIFTFIFFALIANYAGHDFRFVSHIVPFVLLLSLYLSYNIFKAVFNKLILYLLLIFLFMEIGVSYAAGYENIYEKNNFRPWYSVAYKTISDNFDPNNEVVFGHYFQQYYASDIIKTGKVIGMLSHNKFKLDTLKMKLNSNPQGWITWATYKGWHFDEDLIQYVSSNFKKIHGHGIDETNMEVYYYDKSMIPGTDEYNKENKNVFNTNTYLKLDREYSISFWLKSGIKQPGTPFVMKSIENDSIGLNVYSDSLTNGFAIKYERESSNNFIKTGNIFDTTWHHVIFYQNKSEPGNEYGIYIDGKKKDSRIFKNKNEGEVKLLISTLFRGRMQDVRVFNYILTNNQVKAIYNNGEITTAEELFDGKKMFKPFKHFTVRQ